jgi:serine/threonine protein kinase
VSSNVRRYRVVRLIQRAEDAEVFDARAIAIGSPVEERVALRRVRPEARLGQRIGEAFALEMERSLPIEAHGMVRLHDWGVLDDQPFVTSAYLDGRDLASILERMGMAGGVRLSVEVALAIAALAAEAVASVHGAMLTHRDVREEAILIGWDGTVKLADGVIARSRRRVEHPSEPDHDPSADVRALGAMLLHLTWHDQKQERDPDALAIVRRATHEARDRWYRTADEMAADVMVALDRRGAGDSRSIVKDWVGGLRRMVEVPPAKGDLFIAELQNKIARRFKSQVPDQLDVEVNDLVVSQPAPPANAGAITRNPARRGDTMIGSELQGYHLIDLLGRGSVARVYRAAHMTTGQSCAVKVLDGKSVRSEISAKRMVREAMLLRELRHPNLVSVLDSGLTREGQPFMVLELIEGVTLKDVIARHQGPMPVEEITDILIQMAAGLAAAHKAGFVHRDLKPTNVMLLAEAGANRVKILDFGLARVTAPSPEQAQIGTLTGANAFVGTPKYIAPEQIIGASLVGPPADLYSLGVILYEMLTGEPPFGGSMHEILQAQLHKNAPQLPASGGLERIAEMLLRKSPDERLGDAEQLIAEIRAIRFTEEVTDSIPAPAHPNKRGQTPSHLSSPDLLEPHISLLAFIGPLAIIFGMLVLAYLLIRGSL